MSSPYPVLGDRPIDQWKVTELKAELKKRKLAINGLKIDLVKRLDEALRLEKENDESENEEREDDESENEEREDDERGNEERENAAMEDEIKDTNDGFNCEPQTVVAEKGSVAVPIISDKAAGIFVDHESNKSTEVDVSNLQLDINDCPAAFGQDKGQDKDITYDTNTVMVEENPTVHSTSLGSTDVALGGQGSPKSETNLNLNSQLESEESKPQLDKEVVKAAHKDDNLASSASDEQVSEVSHNLGIQVKSDSICTDSVSINGKIELKDNIIADNVKIELDVIKPKIVGPSSTDVVPLGGESHQMDVEEPLEKEVSAEESDDKIATNADINKNNDAADVGSSEKLNLDRSSGDDSMEDDVLESKQIDSKYNSDDKSENKAPVVNEDIHVDVLGDEVSADRKGSPLENKSQPAVVTDKRKNHDEEAAGNSEPVKRQRRWNTNSLKVSEQQGSNITTVSTTPKDSIHSPALKRNYARSDSTASNGERIVPTSQKAPTNCLRIYNFLRPFTLKAVQELVGKSGSVTSFWMDQIKTHCYVAYSSVEEALETRNAVYNLQWPTNGGKLLVAEFVDPEEVKMRVEVPSATPTTINVNTAAAPVGPPPKPSPRQLSPPPLLARERLPPPPEEKVEAAPIVTLDDLFRKTKAVPRIYYLPLSEGQVTARSKQ